MIRVFKFPFCGYRFRADPEGRYEVGSTDIVRGRGHERAGAEGPAAWTSLASIAGKSSSSRSRLRAGG